MSSSSPLSKYLDDTIKFLPTVSQFKSILNKFVRPKGNTFYAIRDSIGIKLLTKIRVTFSDLRDHRYNHNFRRRGVVVKGVEHISTNLKVNIRVARIRVALVLSVRI